VIVLDTNVTSELMRMSPSPIVVAWLRSQEPQDLYSTAISVAEIEYGIARLPNGRRKKALVEAAKDVFSAFPDQIFAFDLAAAAEYGDMVAVRERAGSPINGFDAQIAAICRANGAMLATRNLKDFMGTGITLIDPWAEN
jgi:predicted nucleic acid-binding protein